MKIYIFQVISGLNNLRRQAISNLEETVIINSIKDRTFINDDKSSEGNSCIYNDRKISLAFDNLNAYYDYTKLDKIDNIYIPLSFLQIKYMKQRFFELSSIADIYISMPTIIKPIYKNLLLNNLDSIYLNLILKVL